jgi:hypothetical protein
MLSNSLLLLQDYTSPLPFPFPDVSLVVYIPSSLHIYLICFVSSVTYCLFVFHSCAIILNI